MPPRRKPYRDDATLLDIQYAAERIVRFRGELTFAEFLEDEKSSSAILYQILVLGEAAKRLTAEFRTLSSEIDWRGMASMRDRLIHEYDIVDWEEVWGVSILDVPELLSRLEKYLPTDPEDEHSLPQ